MKLTTPIGDTTTQYGFDCNGLLRVERCCSSRPPERKKWAVLRVIAANGVVVEIQASPRKCWVNSKVVKK